MTTADSMIVEFLAASVPPGGTADWRVWKQRCKDLGPLAVPVFLRTLETGTEEQQITALLALREHGFEAWLDDSSTAIIYRVRRPGEQAYTVIEPRSQPRRPNLPL